MADQCAHVSSIRRVTPSAPGCEECLAIGSPWVHLRLCRTCGHVGCCDNSPNRHATKHFRKTHHPIIARRTIRSSKDTTRPRDGDGATSTR